MPHRSKNSEDFAQELPRYTYVPGLTPHPVSDPRGHWRETRPVCSSPAAAFDFATQLFNAGYYWEAHEVWEGVWGALGRRGRDADRVKGLIKLAACGVKCLEQNAEGARRHASRAAELLTSASERPLGLAGQDEAITEIPVTVFDRARRLAETVMKDPPLPDESARDAAIRGGVPILGQLT